MKNIIGLALRHKLGDEVMYDRFQDRIVPFEEFSPQMVRELARVNKARQEEINQRPLYALARWKTKKERLADYTFGRQSDSGVLGYQSESGSLRQSSIFELRIETSITQSEKENIWKTVEQKQKKRRVRVEYLPSLESLKMMNWSEK